MRNVLRSIIVRLVVRVLGLAVLAVARLVVRLGRVGSGCGRLARALGLLPARDVALGPARDVALGPPLDVAIGRPSVAAPGAPRRPRRMSPRRVVAGVAVTVVLVGLLGGASLGAAHLTSRSGVCRQCHEMGAYYESWSASSHAQAECSACHIQPGIVGLMKAKITGLRQLYVHLTGGELMPLELTADVPNQACRTCHPQSSAGHRPDSAFQYHPVHEGTRCIACHAGVVHGRDPDRPVLGTMASCLECHQGPRRDGGERDGASAPSACGTCHEPPHAETGECGACHELTDWKEPVALVSSIPPASCRQCHSHPRDVAGTTYVFTHGQHDAVDCASCHAGIQHPAPDPPSPLTMDECLACHDGATREGLTAPATCETCHQPPHAAVGACVQCHVVAGWKKAVPLADTVDSKACLACHQLPRSVAYGSSGFSHGAHRGAACASCHTGTLHPVAGGARRMPMKACTECHARTGGPTGCAACHSPPHARYGDCAGCHSRSSWKSRFVHPFKLVGRHAAAECAACHGGTPVLGGANTDLPTRCQDCHGDAAGPGHAGLEECGRCHDPSGWKPADFVHPDVPGMDMSGLSCTQCHPDGYATRSCAPCHAATGP